MDRLRRRRTLAALLTSVVLPRAWAAASAMTDKGAHGAGRHAAAPGANDAAMIGQLLLVNMRYLEDGTRQLALSEATRAMLSAVQPGGVVLYGANILNRPQLGSLIAGIRAELSIPPFIAIDEEGGRVSRIRGLEGTVRVAPARELARQGQDAVDRAYATIADELVALDINMNLAPVADLGFYPELPHLGDRAFSSDPAAVARAVVGAIKALQVRGIVAVVKHFPGHGRTRGNSHQEGSAIAATRAELELDLTPFRAAFAAGVGGLMTAHVAYPTLDPSGLPASVSPRILQGLAREELGFDGLIVTDALEMRGLTTIQTEGDAALAAFAAGADLLMGPTSPQEIHAHLARALAAADATHVRQRLVESYGRIMAIKRRFGILTRAP